MSEDAYARLMDLDKRVIDQMSNEEIMSIILNKLREIYIEYHGPNHLTGWPFEWEEEYLTKYIAPFLERADNWEIEVDAFYKEFEDRVKARMQMEENE